MRPSRPIKASPDHEARGPACWRFSSLPLLLTTRSAKGEGDLLSSGNRMPNHVSTNVFALPVFFAARHADGSMLPPPASGVPPGAGKNGKPRGTAPSGAGCPAAQSTEFNPAQNIVLRMCRQCATGCRSAPRERRRRRGTRFREIRDERMEMVLQRPGCCRGSQIAWRAASALKQRFRGQWQDAGGSRAIDRRKPAG
jgi:hypothetical protein